MARRIVVGLVSVTGLAALVILFLQDWPWLILVGAGIAILLVIGIIGALLQK